jgi:molybdate transport system ATP-binding protein
MAGLDGGLKDRILPYLKQCSEQLGIPSLYATHQLEELGSLAEEILVLEAGRLVRHGALEAAIEGPSRAGPGAEGRRREGKS